MKAWHKLDAAAAQLLVAGFIATVELIRPTCPRCDGEGGHMIGYYEPEFDECRCCNADGDAPDGPTHIWRWQWWLFQFREWREIKRIDAFIDAEVRREQDLRFGENPEQWQ